MLHISLKAVILLYVGLIFCHQSTSALQNVEDILLGEKFVLPLSDDINTGNDEENDNLINISEEDLGLNETSSLSFDNSEGKKAFCFI